MIHNPHYTHTQPADINHHRKFIAAGVDGCECDDDVHSVPTLNSVLHCFRFHFIREMRLANSQLSAGPHSAVER